jgi:phosphonate degradation associated HDIG domain protein
MIGRIMELLQVGAAEVYFGEDVSQLEHALQTAALAERSGAADAMVVAALLHDIGHLLHGRPENVADYGADARHEEVAHAWLATRFGPAVTEPIRLHVPAKRYLCSTEPDYLAGLSSASRISLALQGGPMTPEQAAGFAATPWAEEATVLRRWDDAAKIPGLQVPKLEHYRSRIERLLGVGA